MKDSLLFFLYYSRLSLRISFLNDYMCCLIDLNIIKKVMREVKIEDLRVVADLGWF